VKRNWLLAAGLVLVLVLGMVGLAGCEEGVVSGEIQTLNVNSQQEGVWVTGQGRVSAVPDIATLRLGIEAEKASVAEAQTLAAEAMDRVMAALTANGVAENDIQTQYLSIQRVTRWDRITEEEVVVGFRVTNIVTAKIRDIDKTGSIIDAVAEAGGDLTRVDSISFSIDDPSDYYEEAREEAMADAKAKAEQLAELGDVTLGKPTYISEGAQAWPVTPRYMPGIEYAEEEAVQTPISPGEIELSLTVQVAYAILK